MAETRTFTCEWCKGIFETDWSPEEVNAEMLARFGEVPAEEQASVCDNCDRKLSAYYGYPQGTYSD